jgi:hypothetical protein
MISPWMHNGDLLGYIVKRASPMDEVNRLVSYLSRAAGTLSTP